MLVDIAIYAHVVSYSKGATTFGRMTLSKLALIMTLGKKEENTLKNYWNIKRHLVVPKLCFT
jgi:hypothetical protein